MDRVQAQEYVDRVKQDIRERGRSYFHRDRSGKGYICPICGSGGGKNGTGITTKDGIHFTCWAGCFMNADVIDIIAQERGVDKYSEKIQLAASECGLSCERELKEAFRALADGSADIAPSTAPVQPEYQKQAESGRITQPRIHNNTYTTAESETEIDYTDFFLQANRDIGKTDYHRGLTLQTLHRFNVGYVESWRHPKAPNAPASPRLIIPTSKHSYLARDTRADLTEEQKKYSKSKVGKVRIFNERAIKDATQPVYIVEGEIDAMSIMDVGGEALGLGSISNARRLISIVEDQRPSQPFIIALDNEAEPAVAARVEKAVGELQSGLERLGIPYYRKDIAKPYKDANEALNADREGFAAAIRRAVDEVEDSEDIALEAEREQLKKEAALYSLPNFLKDIEESKRASYVPTGFPSLDKLLDGGLYAGLYIVGAISSLGKTTFCLQIADQIAKAGQDVLIFSLEMARNELIGKSISRLTLENDLELNQTTVNAKTTRGILTGSRYANYSQKERELIQTAIAAYGECAKNIYITEGMGNVGVEHIREKVQRHMKLTGKAPVVMLDYIQILSPADVRATDKQNTDKAVLELKLLSRDYGIPVIGISSFNRDNYTAPVNLASFKESGAIEYSSDVLIGLQYQGMDYQEGESEKDREKRIRGLVKDMVAAAKTGNAQKIQIKILKNRNGSKGECGISFYPMFNYFTEEDSPKGEENNNGWIRSKSNYR